MITGICEEVCGEAGGIVVDLSIHEGNIELLGRIRSMSFFWYSVYLTFYMLPGLIHKDIFADPWVYCNFWSPLFFDLPWLLSLSPHLCDQNISHNRWFLGYHGFLITINFYNLEEILVDQNSEETRILHNHWFLVTMVFWSPSIIMTWKYVDQNSEETYSGYSLSLGQLQKSMGD